MPRRRSYFGAESEKPPSMFSKMFLFTVAAGMKGTSAFSVCSITVRTVRSDIAHSCTRMGTQLCLNAPASILPSPASLASTPTLTWMDCKEREARSKVKLSD